MGRRLPTITPSRNVRAQIAIVDRFIVSPFVKRITELHGRTGTILDVQLG